MEGKRLNVAIARLMELTSLLRKAIDSGPGAADPAVWEGTSALIRMLSCFAPFTAEEAGERLGYETLVSGQSWPEAGPALAAEQIVTCVVQISGKVRDRIEGASDRQHCAVENGLSRGVMLTGDEPTMHPEFDQIVADLYEAGLSTTAPTSTASCPLCGAG